MSIETSPFSYDPPCGLFSASMRFYCTADPGFSGGSTLSTYVIPSGYKNAGNTCYISASLVLLSSTRDFIPALEDLFAQRILRGGSGFVENGFGALVLNVLRSVWNSTPCSARNIKKLKRHLHLDDEEHDAAELVTKLLEAITDYLGVREHAFLGVLEGVIQSTTSCRQCNSSVVVPGFFLLHQVSGEANGNLANVLRPVVEVLQNENSYECSHSTCFPVKQTADKSTVLHSSSTNILFSIGRVHYGIDGLFLTQELVLFPPSITLMDGTVFDLNGVVSHLGNSANSGHYVAYVRNPGNTSGGLWFLVNDEKVDIVESQVVFRLGSEKNDLERPLILQYVRRSV